MIQMRFILRDVCLSLFALKSKMLLALLGITVGSLSIVSLLTINNNGVVENENIYASFDMDTLVAAIQWKRNTSSHLEKINKINLYDDPVIQTMSMSPLSVSSRENMINNVATSYDILAITPGFWRVMSLQLEYGRLLTQFDRHARFAVIGSSLAEVLAINEKN